MLIILFKQEEQLESLFNQLKCIQLKLKFTKETGTNRKIHFLYLTVHRSDKFQTTIYRKPTQENSIHAKSFNSKQNKHNVFKFFLRAYNIYTNPHDLEKEINHIVPVGQSNGCNKTTLLSWCEKAKNRHCQHKSNSRHKNLEDRK